MAEKGRGGGDPYAGLGDRTRESYQRKDNSGRYKSYIRDDIDGLVQWNCASGKHELDVIPYKAGPHDPNVREGDITYWLDVFAHKGIGPTEDNILCMALTYRKPCFICEWIQKQKRQDEYDETLVKQVRASRRSDYNVWVFDNTEEERKGVQVWEVAHFFMEKHLAVIAQKDEDGEAIAFAHPTEGRTVMFEKVGKGQGNVEFIGHRFMKRKYAIPAEILGAAWTLDECIYRPEYDEVREAFMSGFEERDVDTGAGRGGVSRGVGRGLPPEPYVPTSDDDIPFDRGAEGQSRGPTRGAPETGRREEAEQRTAGGVETRAADPDQGGPETCPVDAFGTGTEQHPECPECPLWDDCAAESERLKAEAPPEQRPTRGEAAGSRRTSERGSTREASADRGSGRGVPSRIPPGASSEGSGGGSAGGRGFRRMGK